MARIASEGIRERAIAAYAAKQGSQKEVAAMFRVHPRTFQRWLERYRSDGSCSPLQRGHRRPAFDDDLLAQLDQKMQQHPDATLEQLQEHFSAKVTCSTVAIHNALKRLDWRYKKSRYERQNKTGPT